MYKICNREACTECVTFSGGSTILPRTNDTRRIIINARLYALSNIFARDCSCTLISYFQTLKRFSYDHIVIATTLFLQK